jgi:hypothetical protein
MRVCEKPSLELSIQELRARTYLDHTRTRNRCALVDLEEWLLSAFCTVASSTAALIGVLRIETTSGPSVL